MIREKRKKGVCSCEERKPGGILYKGVKRRKVEGGKKGKGDGLLTRGTKPSGVHGLVRSCP